MMLHTVHAAGRVHGDIRPANLVFFGDTSYLIDYDLAGKEESKYQKSIEIVHVINFT